jgi:septum formation protein
MTTPTLILASGSPRRRELLASLGLDFTVLKPDVDETQHLGEAPGVYVHRLSRQKAAAIAARLGADGAQDATILAADTIVVLAADTAGDLDGEVLGKPADPEEARVMLQRLRARPHIVCTAITLQTLNRDPAHDRAITELTRTVVHMRDYTDAEIESYIATGDPFDKAGGYAIQHEAFRPAARIEGSHTNVVGLPLETLRRMLTELGVPVQS